MLLSRARVSGYVWTASLQKLSPRSLPTALTARWCSLPPSSVPGNGLDVPASSGRMPEGLYDLHQVVGWLRAERAMDVRALSVRGLLGGTIGECLIFATAVSRAHLTRVARTVQIEFKNAGVVRYGQSPAIEGKQSDEWLLIDGGDCVVSVMVDEARANLQLEEHWQAQGATELELPPDELASLEPRLTTAAAMAAFGDGAVESDANAGVPRPPAHWGAGASEGDSNADVYREDDGDVVLDEDDATKMDLKADRLKMEAAEEGDEYEYEYEEDEDKLHGEYAYDEEEYDGGYEEEYYDDEPPPKAKRGA